MARAGDRLDGLARIADERAGRYRARLQAETEEGYRERIRLLESERSRWSATAREAAERHAASAAALQAVQAVAAEADRANADAERALTAARADETAAAQALVRAEGADAAGRATLGAIEARGR